MQAKHAAPRHAKHKRRHLSLWSRFVLLVGYATLLYGLARGVIWVLVLLGGNA